jgi:hypothetical protein
VVHPPRCALRHASAAACRTAAPPLAAEGHEPLHDALTVRTTDRLHTACREKQI